MCALQRQCEMGFAALERKPSELTYPDAGWRVLQVRAQFA